MGIVKDILYKLSPNSVASFRNNSIFPYYHLINDKKLPHIESLYEYKGEAQFRSDLDVLTQNYKPVDLNELLDGEIPENSFLLTFDDGLEEIFSVVYPILEEKNIKAAFFINPDFVDNKKALYKHGIGILLHTLKSNGFSKPDADKVASILNFSYVGTDDFIHKTKAVKFSDRQLIFDALQAIGVDIQAYLQQQKLYVSKDQIKQMLDAGHFFGGHTISHPPLEQLTFEDQKKEIIDSIEWVKENFGITYSMFAFPFSDKKISKKLIEALFAYDNRLMLFGNSGMKKDIHPRIIQRFSIENPHKKLRKVIVTENLYKFYNKVIGQYNTNRK